MSQSTELVRVDTGEVVAERHFDFGGYLSTISGNESLTRQQQLCAAYDAACASLIGPNDVQVEGGRTFKKKSAWRKLARHFSISTSVVAVSKETIEGVFVATVTVRASAPWGQDAEAVGACGTDEATGRRTITIADAVATAETRATNRAVSNLVAMGEVSAEEMSKDNSGRGVQASAQRGERSGDSSSPSASTRSNGAVMPFGKSKGKLLSEMDAADLEGALNWAAEKGKFEDFQRLAAIELETRDAESRALEPSY